MFQNFQVCEGERVVVRVGREFFEGCVTSVSAIAIVIDNVLVVRISRITWLLKKGWCENGS